MINIIHDINLLCYIAWNCFPTARALIGYFKVTWHLTMKLFPDKISARGTLQDLWRQRVTVYCCPQMLTDDRRYSEVLINEFPASKFSAI